MHCYFARELGHMMTSSAVQAVEKAHESYEAARARAVSSKDALRNALAQRDALTEVLRSSPYTTEAEADSQLKRMQDKVISDIFLIAQFVASKCILSIWRHAGEQS